MKYLKQGGYGAKIDRKGPNRQNRPKCVNRAPVGMHVRRWVYMLIEFTCPSGLPALADAQSPRWNQPGGVRISIFASPGRYRDGAMGRSRRACVCCVDVVGDIPPEYRDPGQDLQERPAPTLHTHTRTILGLQVRRRVRCERNVRAFAATRARPAEAQPCGASRPVGG